MRITRTPAWAKGMQKLMPGVYARGRQLHLCLPELCEFAGCEYNEHNVEKLSAAARKVFRQIEAEAPVEFVEIPEP